MLRGTLNQLTAVEGDIIFDILVKVCAFVYLFDGVVGLNCGYFGKQLLVFDPY